MNSLSLTDVASAVAGVFIVFRLVERFLDYMLVKYRNSKGGNPGPGYDAFVVETLKSLGDRLNNIDGTLDVMREHLAVIRDRLK